MKRLLLGSAVLALGVGTVSAQGNEAEHMASGGPVADIRPLYDEFAGWVLKAAEQMPEADYSFRPVETVRSFSELIGHVADANFTFCAAALQQDAPDIGTPEKLTSKAALVAITKRSIEYCDGAYQQPHGMAHDQRELFNQTGSLTWLLAWNATHNAEHYGNIVTYMRLKGMVPPSSQGN